MTHDQLHTEAERDGACLSCHEELAEDVQTHTHQRAPSEASRCYSCHMPHTTWGLLGGIRAHRIDSPSVATTLATGRPDACSFCHLDRSLGDISVWMTRWYGHEPVEMPAEQRDVAASVRRALSGDAVQRATIAWHMGYPPARTASGENWQAVYLVELLDDPYAAVRFSASQSLSGYPGFEDLHYDVQWPSCQRKKTMVEARRRVRLRGDSDRAAHLIFGGEIGYAEILALKALGDDRSG